MSRSEKGNKKLEHARNNHQRERHPGRQGRRPAGPFHRLRGTGEAESRGTGGAGQGEASAAGDHRHQEPDGEERYPEGHELRGGRDRKRTKRTDRRSPEMKSPYDDIIHLPHHVSQNHPQMPMLDRAAQFAPFAALTGYEAAVGETARLTAERRELDAQEAEELNRRLVAIIARLPDRPEATIEYFVPDDRKAGGAFVSVTGRVRHISVPERTLVMEDGTVIPLDDVVSVASEIF